MALFDILPYHLQDKIMDMKNKIEIDEELSELIREPSHIDLPFIKEYPIVQYPSRISNDIKFVNFMQNFGGYCRDDYYNVTRNILCINVHDMFRDFESPTTENKLISLYKETIEKYLEDMLGITNEIERQVIMYRMLNKVRNIRVSYSPEYNRICEAYVELFTKESKPLVLRYGEPIKSIRIYRKKFKNSV